MESLDLSWNLLSDIKVLENVKFKELKEFYLQKNPISDLKALEKVKFNRLKILNLSNNEIDDNKYSSIIANLKFEVIIRW